MNHGTILIADDNEDDVFFILRALERAGISHSVQVVESGEQALDYLKGVGRYSDRAKYPLPKLTFMDVKMPGKSGLDVLGEIRRDSNLKHLVVVMLTTAGYARDVSLAACLGANSFLIKPNDTDDLNKLFQKATDYWLQVHQHVDLMETSAFQAGI